MKQLLSILACLLLVSPACSHMPSTVKDVNWDNDGNLVLRKCDLKHDWVVYFLVWHETNCRDEKKNADVLTAKSVSPPSQQPLGRARLSVSASDVDVVPAIMTSKQNAHAIVIGIEEYQQKLPKADYAAHDAEIMGQYLTKALGYKEENVVVLLNERATKTSMEKYVEGWLVDRVEKGDSVFIYYSGHGAPIAPTGRGV